MDGEASDLGEKTDRWWCRLTLDVPETLKTVPGIWSDPLKQDAAHALAPLHDWDILHAKAHAWYRRIGWRAFLPVMPRSIAVAQKNGELGARARGLPHHDEASLRLALEARARELGIDAIGVARFDAKFSPVEHQGLEVGDRVIVCVLEQAVSTMERIPSWESERGAQDCTLTLQERTIELARALQEMGYNARPNVRWLAIPYAVQAGLGQLGMNGQLLTPVAGSRCRLELISTDAPLAFGEPVDFGINRLCDECQICARRCPPGAIPLKRKEHRGVIKSKLNAARCFPVVAQAGGCAVCMRVCPVQRYGLRAVLDQYASTGQILGKGTDELEGYTFGDGEYYGPDEHPQLPKSYFDNRDMAFDPGRTVPDEIEEDELRDSSKSGVSREDEVR